MTLIDQLFETSNFLPRGVCMFWDPELLSATTIIHIAIALACLSIPIQLAWAVRNVTPHWIVAMLGIFILMCGASSVVQILTIFYPYYWLAAATSGFTAIVAVAIAALLPVAVNQWVQKQTV